MNVRYFANGISYHGRLELLDITAADPKLEVNQILLEDHDDTDTDDNANPNESKTVKDAKKQFKQFSKSSLAWLSKAKEDMVKAVDDVKKDYEQKNQDSKVADIEYNFSDSVHFKSQNAQNLPSYFGLLLIDKEEVEQSKGIHSLVATHGQFKWKWKEAECFIHRHCMYIDVGSEGKKQWEYLSFYSDSVQLIPIQIVNDIDATYFYWTDALQNYVVGRCASSNGRNGCFVDQYTFTKTSVLSLSMTEYLQVLRYVPFWSNSLFIM